MPDISYGEATDISPQLRRITAPNKGIMTGPGTNSYVVGTKEVALIDPGPEIDTHIEAVIRLFGDRLKWILVTHTHRDHSPAARILADRTGAELIGNVIENDGYQDTSFQNARLVGQDECIETPEFTIRAVLTPGHVSNHVCYYLEEDQILITGDHIMGGSTVVIVPPAGNMKDYIESLELLSKYEIAFIAPGHGDVIENPQEEIRHLIAHRLGREKKVIDALKLIAPADVEELVTVVYTDVDESLHTWAAKSLHAHLLKLQLENQVQEHQTKWSFIGA